jgi:hypothetical protein
MGLKTKEREIWLGQGWGISRELKIWIWSYGQCSLLAPVDH